MSDENSEQIDRLMSDLEDAKTTVREQERSIEEKDARIKELEDQRERLRGVVDSIVSDATSALRDTR